MLASVRSITALRPALRAALPAVRALAAAAEPTPGFSDSKIATSMQQSAGPEFEELMHETVTGSGRFWETPLEASFGTVESPVIVPSAMGERIVGCTGGEPGSKHHHEVLWFNLSGDGLHMCAECGQVFKLGDVRVSASAAAEAEAKLAALESDKSD
eukprot:PLAT15552.11.p2 GENE.PLAT15552.11~~PLAT15552.11.p2  ORF type:complete len:172 (-),score=57.14 PLAT15552.11:178-648(-)